MASIKKRNNGNLSLVFWWQGKQWIKALGTTDETEAQRIKQDAEAQLDRIRQGKSALAARLLADGIPIIEVLFGSPEVALRLGKEPGNENPLTLSELTKAYLGGLPGNVSSEHRYAVDLWLKHVREFLGDDRPVMSLTAADLEAYRKKRIGPDGENTVSLKKELTYLKSAIDWAVENKLLSTNPIPRWPTIKTTPRKRFEWKADIEAMIADHEFKNDADKQAFLEEMKARLVLTAEDMRKLVDLAREKIPKLALPLMLVCATGIRRGEMVKLKKADFDAKRGTIIVESQKQSRSEQVTYRTIVLGEDVLKALRDHARELPKTERLLFPVFKNSTPGYQGRWKKAGKERKQSPQRLRAERASRMLDDLVSGTEFELMSGWHCLRHSFISLCVAKGTDWPQISAWVRHVNQRTTQLYTHFNTAESIKRMEALEIRF